MNQTYACTIDPDARLYRKPQRACDGLSVPVTERFPASILVK